MGDGLEVGVFLGVVSGDVEDGFVLQGFGFVPGVVYELVGEFVVVEFEVFGDATDVGVDDDGGEVGLLFGGFGDELFVFCSPVEGGDQRVVGIVEMEVLGKFKDDDQTEDGESKFEPGFGFLEEDGQSIGGDEGEGDDEEEGAKEVGAGAGEGGGGGCDEEKEDCGFAEGGFPIFDEIVHPNEEEGEFPAEEGADAFDGVSAEAVSCGEEEWEGEVGEVVFEVDHGVIEEFLEEGMSGVFGEGGGFEEALLAVGSEGEENDGQHSKQGEEADDQKFFSHFGPFGISEGKDGKDGQGSDEFVGVVGVESKDEENCGEDQVFDFFLVEE